MRRWLVFDAGCAKCDRVARAVQRECGSWAEARPLHDAEVQAALRRGSVDLGFEPALIEVTGERVRVWRGWRLRQRLARQLGVRSGMRVLRARRLAVPASAEDASSRRQFIVRLVGVAGAAVAGGSLAPVAEALAHRRRVRRYGMDSAVARALRRSPVVAEAEAHYGALDLSLIVEHPGPSRAPMYAVTFKSTADDAVRILLTNAPSASGVPLHAAVAVIPRQRPDHAALYRIDGQPFGGSEALRVPHSPRAVGRQRHRAVRGATFVDPYCLAANFVFYFNQLMCGQYVPGCLLGNSVSCGALLSCVANAYLLAFNFCTGGL